MSNQLRQFALGRKEAADYVTGDLLSEFSPATPPPAQPQAYPVGQPISDEDMMMGAMAASPATPALIESAASQGLPVEEMLGGLLDDMYGPETTDADNKKLRSQMMLRGLGLGLSQLSQGNPIDLTTVAEQHNRDKQQRAQTRLARVKSQAAAEMLLEQGGSPEMAKAIATGAISYGDFLTKTQMDRAEARAAAAVAREAEQNGALADSLKEMGASDVLVNAAENGIFSKLMTARTQMATLEQTEQAAADRSAVLAYYMDVFDGDLGKARAAMSGAVTEANAILTQEANLETLTRQNQQAEDAAAGRVSIIEQYRASGDPFQAQVADMMEGDPTLSVTDATTAVREVSIGYGDPDTARLTADLRELYPALQPDTVFSLAHAIRYPEPSEFEDYGEHRGTVALLREAYPDMSDQDVARTIIEAEAGDQSSREELISLAMERGMSREEAITSLFMTKVSATGGLLDAATGLPIQASADDPYNISFPQTPYGGSLTDLIGPATGLWDTIARVGAKGIENLSGGALSFGDSASARDFARKTIVGYNNQLARALMDSDRFTATQFDSIMKEIAVKPDALTTDRAMYAELKAVDGILDSTIRDAAHDVLNAESVKERSKARAILDAALDYRVQLGMPTTGDTTDPDFIARVEAMGAGARIVDVNTGESFITQLPARK